MKSEKYIAFLRGINVSGYHKIPMTELKKEFETLNLKNIQTILNSGNIIFESNISNKRMIEKTISEHLEKVFGFPIPTILRNSENIIDCFSKDPFERIVMTKDIRLYVSFLKKDNTPDLQLPWSSADKSFHILLKIDQNIFSVLDLSISKSIKAMEALEKFYGKDITTRNWNTIKRLRQKL